MTQYNTLNVIMSNSQESGIKNNTEATFKTFIKCCW